MTIFKVRGSRKNQSPTVLAPCNQCLNCRINRRDYWTARALLESHSAISAQFWTLTFSDSGLDSFHSEGSKKLVRKFCASLRASERRAGNGSTIRCFGAMEYGETLGRPHVHLLIFNMLKNLRDSAPYKAGLPRPRFHFGHWPHGHVDISSFDQTSARYVCKYVTAFETKPDEKPLPFHVQRPPLGYAGLVMLAESLSRSPAGKWVQPRTIRLDGKTWALDPPTERFWLKQLRKCGLDVSEFLKPTKATRKAERALERECDATYQVEEQLRKEAVRSALYESVRRSKEMRLFRAYQDALTDG